MDWDFTFVVSGADVDDQAAVDALLEDHDALLVRAGGVDLLSVTGSGDSAVEAALAALSAAGGLCLTYRCTTSTATWSGCMRLLSAQGVRGSMSASGSRETAKRTARTFLPLREP
jgi:hypothetical protein